jgi:polyisoprenoid-binding protein YceI
MSIKAASLEIINDVSDRDRREMRRTMNEEALETAKYPDIVFESCAVSRSPPGEGPYRVNIRGKLSLHGVARSQMIGRR